MAFCTKCGTPFEAETTFCGNCGSSVAAAPAIQPSLSEDAPQRKKTIFLIALSVLVVAGFLAFFFIKHSSYSAINTVRDGYLDYNRTTTVGNALKHAFLNGSWRTFTANDGATVVEFDGKAAFSQLYRAKDMNAVLCQATKPCMDLFNHLVDSCKEPETSSNYQNQNACLDDKVEQAASTQIPIAIQFTINNDKTFQIAATDQSWSTDEVLYFMYDQRL
jgi:hypothetical protein